MKRILITGMSGTGKSAVIGELAARGYASYDLDAPEWSEWVAAAPTDTLTPAEGRDWIWRIDRIRRLLSEHRDGTLFISGTAENMSALFPLIDVIVLLSAPLETILERLEARSAGGYGCAPEQRRKVMDLIAAVEPLLRETADLEIDTRKPVQATVDELLRLT